MPIWQEDFLTTEKYQIEDFVLSHHHQKIKTKSLDKKKIPGNYLNENDEASNQCQRIHKKLLMLSGGLGSYPGRQLKSPSEET